MAFDGAQFLRNPIRFDRMDTMMPGVIDTPDAAKALETGRLGGATARVGYYVTEALAVEADAAWLEDCAGLGVQGLWHIWGYERFDPFLTFGARGWIDGDLGPVAGLGAFYHLTDNWSLRADAQATLGIDSDCDMVYSLGAGVQYTF
jgi:hypothetical protein